MAKGEKTKKILIIRHGQTDFNLDRVPQGWADTFLNPTGVSQAQAAARLLKNYPIDLIFASDLKRAYHTAWLINQYHNHKIITTPLLRERNLGKLAYHKVADTAWMPPPLIERDYARLRGWVRDLEMESRPDFEARLRNFWFGFLLTYPVGQKVVLVVTHGGVIMASLRVLKARLPSDYRAKNTELITLNLK